AGGWGPRGGNDRGPGPPRQAAFAAASTRSTAVGLATTSVTAEFGVTMAPAAGVLDSTVPSGALLECSSFTLVVRPMPRPSSCFVASVRDSFASAGSLIGCDGWGRPPPPPLVGGPAGVLVRRVVELRGGGRGGGGPSEAGGPFGAPAGARVRGGGPVRAPTPAGTWSLACGRSRLTVSPASSSERGASARGSRITLGTGRGR